MAFGLDQIGRFRRVLCLLASVIPLLFAFQNSRAEEPLSTGLRDEDSIRFGMVVLKTSELISRRQSGGLRVEIIGKHKAAGRERSFKSEGVHSVAELRDTLLGFGDYYLTLAHIAESQVTKTDLKAAGGDSGGAVFARNESIAGEISGKTLNEGFARAKAECPECQSFVLLVGQDFGWGIFDSLPIRQYSGAHSLNRGPRYFYEPYQAPNQIPDHKTDQQNHVGPATFEVFNGYIEYSRK